MNIVVTTNLRFLDNQKDKEQFFCENKVALVVPDVLMVSRFPKFAFSSFKKDSIIVVAPYCITKFATDENSYASRDYIEGPGNIENIMSYILHYYKQNYEISSVLIMDTDSSSNQWEHKIVKLLKHSINNDKVNHNLCQKQNRKILFLQGYGTVYASRNELFEKNERFLRTYLEQGNFLAMFESTGMHLGRPFQVDNMHQEYLSNYNKKMIAFYHSIEVEPVQVMDFKVTHVGISFDGSTCNLGWLCGTEKLLILSYLKYLEENGYGITELYAFDFFSHTPLMDTVLELGGVGQKTYPNFDDEHFAYDCTPLCQFGYQKILKN